MKIAVACLVLLLIFGLMAERRKTAGFSDKNDAARKRVTELEAKIVTLGQDNGKTSQAMDAQFQTLRQAAVDAQKLANDTQVKLTGTEATLADSTTKFEETTRKAAEVSAELSGTKSQLESSKREAETARLGTEKALGQVRAIQAATQAQAQAHKWVPDATPALK